MTRGAGPNLPTGGWPGREGILLASLRDGTIPSPGEIVRLARRIWEGVEGDRAGAWNCLPTTSPGYRRAMRMALAALRVASTRA